MAGKNIRNMKVCGMSGYKYKAVPTITLKGQWLNAWGFGIDDPVMVKCEDGKLVIEKVFDKTEMSMYITMSQMKSTHILF